MQTQIHGYQGVMLEINLTSETIKKTPVSKEDYEKYIGGRGLGMKLLWDRLDKPGVDPLSPENPLMFMTGPFSGFPIPSASRVVVVTKSPCTSPMETEYPNASTVSYSNMGGFLGPEIRFAGYDGIIITGKARRPVYIVIDDGRVKIKSAKKFWGMKTDRFDREFAKVLGHKRFQTCYIGPAGENQVSYACILHTAARAAGRGGGAVMGAKNLKAIAVRGTGMPGVYDHKGFVSALEDARDEFKGPYDNQLVSLFRGGGTTGFIESISDKGLMAVKNYREGTFLKVDQIGLKAAREKAWKRDFACYCCPLACKKSGVIGKGDGAVLVHDGPEYETGVMFGANLMVSDFNGLMKSIYDGDDLGMDIISAGNVIGFLMEAYEKGYVTKADLDGIDLKWGNVNAVLAMIDRISRREGIGDLAAKGIRAVSEKIGADSEKFAIHVKGLPLAAHNIHANPPRALCYATSNRGACHLSGDSAVHQNFVAMVDSLGLCLFASDHNVWFYPGLDAKMVAGLMTSITGVGWTGDKLFEAGERVFNLEKMFNLREGFGRRDDCLPERFFTEPLTVGGEEGAVLDRDDFDDMLTRYYTQRGWDPETTRPSRSKLDALGLGFLSD